MKLQRIKHKLTTESGFHLIRSLPVEHNVRRLRAHIDRIARTPGYCRWMRKIRLKNRIRAMKTAA
jgi:hypothetical protein